MNDIDLKTLVVVSTRWGWLILHHILVQESFNLSGECISFSAFFIFLYFVTCNWYTGVILVIRVTVWHKYSDQWLTDSVGSHFQPRWTIYFFTNYPLTTFNHSPPWLIVQDKIWFDSLVQKGFLAETVEYFDKTSSFHRGGDI